jgi:protein-tyrosine-phosphatase
MNSIKSPRSKRFQRSMEQQEYHERVGSHATANVLHKQTPTENSNASVAKQSYSPTARHCCFHAVQ